MTPEELRATGECRFPNGPSHKANCHCGRKARYHVMYGSGCGNVCGVHVRKMQTFCKKAGRQPIHVEALS